MSLCLAGPVAPHDGHLARRGLVRRAGHGIDDLGVGELSLLAIGLGGRDDLLEHGPEPLGVLTGFLLDGGFREADEVGEVEDGHV